MQTLARFIQNKRNELGLTQKGLAIAANIPLEDIEEVEAGKELFLPVTIRQALAKVLKCEPSEIKRLEKIIEAAEKQHTMMTRKEQKQWERNYNRINNEGGDGYIPKNICVEDYEAAKAELAEIRRKAK